MHHRLGVTMIPEHYTYPRYLRAKRSVDDRALNRGVMTAAFENLPSDRPARIVELGGGVGTMVDRLIENGDLRRADYLLVDAEPVFLAEANEVAPRWSRGGTRNRPAATDASVAVTTHEGRLEDWLAQNDETFDLIIAHAVLDLVDVAAVLPKLLSALDERGTFWATINFDGDTIFTPKDATDAKLIAAYHRSMDERTRDGASIGSSTAGRELFGHARDAGGVVVAAGSSDWVVFAGNAGYEGDEAYFVHHIIHTVEEELKDHPELSEAVRRWGELRHAQVERAELVYIAHQLDFAIQR